jgi:integrase
MGRSKKPVRRFVDLEIRALKPRQKCYRVSEAGGLSLLIQPGGSRSWQLRYRFMNRKTGKWSENIVSFGSFPEVSLKEARTLCAAAKEKIEAGELKGLRRYQKAETQRRLSETATFATLAGVWLAQAKELNRWSPKVEETIEMRLDRFILPVIGDLPIATVTVADTDQVLAAHREGEKWTAFERIHSIMREVFETAVEQQLIPANPLKKLKRAVATKGHQPKHHAALTDPREVAVLMRTIRRYEGGVVVGAALRLAPLVFLRPGELQNAEWSEIDLDTATWLIPARRMKMRLEHIVPLSTQAVAILRELREVTGDLKHVFPGSLNLKKPMSENAIRSALQSLGYGPDRMTPHGFRAMARTLLDEQKQVNPLWIEAQLAHTIKDPLGRAYNRATYLMQRRAMMQEWADYLDELVAGKPS